MIEKGVLRETTRLMGIKASSCVAWEAVRGKPSSMKDAEGSSDVWGEDWAREGCSTYRSVSKSCWAADAAVEDSVRGCVPPGGKSQPLVLSSWRMSRRIIASGTRAPDFIVLSALMP